MKILPLFALLIFYKIVFSQTVNIQKVELAGEAIIVHYDLEDSNPTNEYTLDLFASKDNYSVALKRVKGDIGQEIKPGKGKKVEWRLRDEYGGFKGKLAFELRGKVFTPIVKIQEFNAEKKYRRGKSYPLKWRPGNSNPINIELYKGSQRLNGEVNHPNSGSSVFTLPSDAEKGDDYKLKITDTKNPEAVVYTTPFRVIPKTPLLIKIIVPLAVVGGVVMGLGGGGGEGTTTLSDLSLPPFPGGN